MAGLAQRTDQAYETTDPLAEESELLQEVVGYQCLFLCGVECEVELESILKVEVDGESVGSNCKFQMIVSFPDGDFQTGICPK